MSSAAVDPEVIRRGRRGDRTALAQIWRAHHSSVLRYLHTLGVVAAEDVASDVWESVARSLRRFDGDADDFRRWLFTIARRRMIDHLRRNGRRLEEPVGSVPEDRACEPQWPVTGWADAAAILGQLAPSRAEVVALRFIGGFSVRETALITGRSAGAVRVLTHRALTDLRDKLTRSESLSSGV